MDHRPVGAVLSTTQRHLDYIETTNLGPFAQKVLSRVCAALVVQHTHLVCEYFRTSSELIFTSMYVVFCSALALMES